MRSLILLSCFVFLAVVSASEWKAEEVRQSFKKTYGAYIVGVEVTTLAEFGAGDGFSLSVGEHWSDECLSVAISADAPQFSELPNVFLGVRVFYHKVHGHPSDSDSSTGPKMTHSEVEVKKSRFEAFYATHDPWNAYFDEAEVSTLEMANRTVLVTLFPGEDWSDFCIVARLTQNGSPNDITFPEVFQGVHVVYVVRAERSYTTVVVVPVTLLFSILLCMTACCLLACRRRRQCKNGFHAVGSAPAPETSAFQLQHDQSTRFMPAPYPGQFPNMGFPAPMPLFIAADGSVYPAFDPSVYPQAHAQAPWYGMGAPQSADRV